MTLAYYDTANTKLRTYVQYGDTAKTNKLYEYTYDESSGHPTLVEYNPGDMMKVSASTYWENGHLKTRIEYESDGTTKRHEAAYHEDGKEKIRISYQSGTSIAEFSCENFCHPERNGLPAEYMTLTYYDAEQTKLESYIQYRDTGKSEKWYEYTYWEDNGNRKTSIKYKSDGATKESESTYWECNGKQKTSIGYSNFNGNVLKTSEYTFWGNGRKKTEIIYQSDGTKESGYPLCHNGDSSESKTCTQERHGCTSDSDTCIIP